MIGEFFVSAGNATIFVVCLAVVAVLLKIILIRKKK